MADLHEAELQKYVQVARFRLQCVLPPGSRVRSVSLTSAVKFGKAGT